MDGERPLLLLLLPARLEAMPQRAPIEQLLGAPAAIAVEPPRVPLSATLAGVVAHRQAKRMRLPGVPHAIAVFDPHQIPLAGALIMRHPESELWSLAGPEPQADFTFDLAAAEDLGPAWQRMERLGIESGRLGSERVD
ncbi:MAG: hypothetical protein ACJ8AO_15105 [Gemmatimonadaceae bacterium]